MKLSRRSLLAGSLLGGFAGLLACRRENAPKVRITGFELLPVRATPRTVWLIVRLHTDAGISGLGEASDAFGFANTTKENAATMESHLRGFFEILEGSSPLDVVRYRAEGLGKAAREGTIGATAFSALEQAMWDLAGQMFDLPTYTLFGLPLRDRLPVYANINRATQPRTPQGFADTARWAVADGFRALKAAPFDGFPPPDSPRSAIEAALEQGIASMFAMREAVGPEIDLMVDCHSFFDVPMALDVAKRLEPVNLTWYEEPVDPQAASATAQIHRAIKQPMAGGEMLFGAEGFVGLCGQRAVDVIMPDVKHCGGLLEMTHIAAFAAFHDIQVAPHNPSGPVSTAATVQICAGMPNFRYMELQWGEAPWRGDLLDPPERFEQGMIAVPKRPGFGVRLRDDVVKNYLN